MSILELPIELLQPIIDIAVQHNDLQCAVRFRETCHRFNEVVQNSIFHSPKTNLLQWGMARPMRRRFVRLKMLRGDANELLLCYTINRTADYLADRTTPGSRDRYVQVLESSAINTLMYWRLLDCLTTERQRPLLLEELKDNALVAAVGVGEMATVQKLLEDGANPASNTPFFGEPLAMAASSGSLDMVRLLLARWDWEDPVQLTGLRLAKAIEAAAVAGHEAVLAKLFDHKDRVAWVAYDDAIMRMIECNQTAFVERLLDLRQEDSTPKAKAEFWLRVVRTTAEYGRQTLLQRILAEHLPDIGESSLMKAMRDACLENHGQMLQIITPHLSVSDQTRHYHHDSVFWAAWHGNVEALKHLLTFLESDRHSLLVAFAGAVSGKALGAIEHLSKVAGISPISQHIATRFTDIARLMLSDMIVEPTGSFSQSDLMQELRVAAGMGELANVINISDTMQAQFPNEPFLGASAFSNAADHKRLDVLLFLCENWAPHLLTSYAKSPAVAQIFMDFGWEINQTDTGSVSPRLGSFVHDKHFTRWLLDKGASAEFRGEYDDITSVSTSISRASMPTIRLLLSRSSGIQLGRLLHLAVNRTDNQSAVPRKGPKYYSLPRKVADSREVVELLLNLGFPIDRTWYREDTDLRRPSETGTALFMAASRGRDEMVAYLLSRGADATLVSTRGRTALDAAESGQYSRVVQLLRQ